MNKFLIKLVMLFNGVWKRMNVNTNHLKIILETKLKIDGRRKNTFSQGTNFSEGSSMDLIAMGVFFLMGVILLLCLYISDIAVTGITIYLSAWTFLLLFTLVSEFSDVLIEVSDNYILLPRPVDNRTIAIARIIHIFLYLFRLTIAFALPGIFLMIYTQGIIAGIVLLLQIFVTVIFAIFFVNILYLSILRFSTPQKFKDVINYFQIGFVIFTLSLYYVLPNIIDFNFLRKMDVTESFVSYFVPTVWIGSWWEFFVEWNFSKSVLILSALGFITPLICVWLISNVFSKGFSQKLIGIGQGNNNDISKNKDDKKVPKNPWMNFWKKIIIRSKEEASGFEITWLKTERNRKFKLKTYPIFGYIPAYFVYVAAGGKGTLEERWEKILEQDIYIFLLYLTAFTMMIIVFNIRYSDKDEASWFFYALPVQKPGRILKGVTKAIITRFCIPFFFIISLVIFSVWGIRSLSDIFVGFINVLFYTVLLSRMAMERLPFTEPWENQKRGDNIAWSMIGGLLIMLIGFFHYMCMDYHLLLLGWCIVAIITIHFLLKDFDKGTWKSIK